MLESSLAELANRVNDSQSVLDVGGWMKPLVRADWVLDVMPYATRGQHGRDGAGAERFTERTWVQRDICGREPWPFHDHQFDFAVCSHTLEDVRDPIWVCSELNRIARAGYIEVPSRLDEQTLWIQGPWVGWGHHHWFIDIEDDRLDFVFKTHVVNGRQSNHFSPDFLNLLSPEDRVNRLWWEESFEFRERLLFSAEEVDSYLSDFVAREQRRFKHVPARRGRLARWAGGATQG